MEFAMFIVDHNKKGLGGKIAKLEICYSLREDHCVSTIKRVYPPRLPSTVLDCEAIVA